MTTNETALRDALAGSFCVAESKGHPEPGQGSYRLIFSFSNMDALHKAHAAYIALQSPSQPVVQGGRVTQADWDKAVDSLEANAGTVFSKIDHALSAHSQTDTQEGDSVAFLATTEAMDDVKSHRSAWRIWSGTERRTIWTGPTRAAGEAWAAQNGIVIDQVEHFEP